MPATNGGIPGVKVGTPVLDAKAPKIVTDALNTAQKGARITQAILEEAQKSAPWLQALSAKFSPDGYPSGVTLTPQQMTSMVDLAKNRLTQDQRKYAAVQQEAARGFQSCGTSQTKNDTSGNMFRNAATYCLFDIFQLVSRSTRSRRHPVTYPASGL
jgi:hypothetical protein